MNIEIARARAEAAFKKKQEARIESDGGIQGTPAGGPGKDRKAPRIETDAR
jgi:hypothetical protein